MTIDQQFFELLRAAIGTQEKLSRIPTEREWALIYKMAKKQSLVGVCFAGVQKLNNLPHQQGDERGSLPEMLYLTWMGMAAKIQRRNELLNRQCAELRKRLADEGFCSCILKGQGVAKLYGSLAGLRQSGDIDVWLWPKGDWNLKHEERFKKIHKFLEKVGYDHTTYHNSTAYFFPDTEVEAHYTPSWMYSPMKNRRLQKWFVSVAEKEMKCEFSSVAFNEVFVLQHIYRHLFGEGIGMRQVVDYFFVLKHEKEVREVQDVQKILKELGLMKFAGALMYILESHLGLEEKYLLCPADPEEGAFLLNEIMQAGNFGHYDERISRERKGLLGGFWMHVKRNMHFVTHYPSEVLWCPLWKVWHQLWLKRMDINK